MRVKCVNIFNHSVNWYKVTTLLNLTSTPFKNVFHTCFIKILCRQSLACNTLCCCSQHPILASRTWTVRCSLNPSPCLTSPKPTHQAPYFKWEFPYKSSRSFLNREAVVHFEQHCQLLGLRLLMKILVGISRLFFSLLQWVPPSKYIWWVIIKTQEVCFCSHILDFRVPSLP